MSAEATELAPLPPPGPATRRSRTAAPGNSPTAAALATLDAGHAGDVVHAVDAGGAGGAGGADPGDSAVRLAATRKESVGEGMKGVGTTLAFTSVVAGGFSALIILGSSASKKDYMIDLAVCGSFAASGVLTALAGAGLKKRGQADLRRLDESVGA